MSAIATITGFWVDHEYDYDKASDGISRYSAYVRDRITTMFSDAWDFDSPSVAVFASAAWHTATSPVMSPGFVRDHERVLGARVERNNCDGSLLAVVELATGWPTRLDNRDWQRRTDRHWRSWEAEFGQHYLEPSEDQARKNAYLLTTSRMVFPISTNRLPILPTEVPSSSAITALAHECVETLVAELNRTVTPVITTLEGGAS